MIKPPDDPFAPLPPGPQLEEANEGGDGLVCTPVPPHAEHPARAAGRLFGRQPDKVWLYLGSDGSLLFAVARWDEPHGGKIILPLAWVRQPKWPGSVVLQASPLTSFASQS